MIAEISKRISIALLKSNAINQDELNVYAYGIQLLIMSIFDWCITFFFMWLIGEIYLSITYLIVFFLLRRHCGGYHAETHTRCIIASNVVFVASVLLSANMRYENFKIWLFIGEIINYIMIYIFSPAEHHNKPITSSKLTRHRKLGILFNTIISVASVILVLNGLDKFACAILLGQLSVSVAVVLQKAKNSFGKEAKTNA